MVMVTVTVTVTVMHGWICLGVTGNWVMVMGYCYCYGDGDGDGDALPFTVRVVGLINTLPTYLLTDFTVIC